MAILLTAAQTHVTTTYYYMVFCVGLAFSQNFHDYGFALVAQRITAAGRQSSSSLTTSLVRHFVCVCVCVFAGNVWAAFSAANTNHLVNGT